MIENYVHWNEDIGEWQLVSIHPAWNYGVELVRAAVEEGGAGWIRSELGGPFVAVH